jgi:uracil-DNA glycosylase
VPADSGPSDLPGSPGSPGTPGSLDALEARICACRRCPRLVAWREQVARVKRAAFADQEYWGRPVPGFGDPGASIVVLGLAPAAHGANRTGRMFTGDRSGEWLYRALWRAGLASAPESVARDDGLTLNGCWVTAAVRCAPPLNKPSVEERDECGSWLTAELALLPNVRVVVCLGAFAWEAALREFGSPRPKPRFAHGAEVSLPAAASPPRSATPMPAAARSDACCSSDLSHNVHGFPITLLASYHVSQQNTFTGKLTEPMLDAVFTRAVELARG